MEVKIYQDREKIADTGNIKEDYCLLFPQTVAEAVAYKNNFTDEQTLKALLDYILLNAFKSIDKETPNFTETGSLIELFNGDDLSTMIGKLAKSITELKTLLNFVGKTDISKIGDGTVTGAISFLNDQFTDNYGAIESAIDEANRESEE